MNNARDKLYQIECHLSSFQNMETLSLKHHQFLKF